MPFRRYLTEAGANPIDSSEGAGFDDEDPPIRRGPNVFREREFNDPSMSNASGRSTPTLRFNTPGTSVFGDGPSEYVETRRNSFSRRDAFGDSFTVHESGKISVVLDEEHYLVDRPEHLTTRDLRRFFPVLLNVAEQVRYLGLDKEPEPSSRNEWAHISLEEEASHISKLCEEVEKIDQKKIKDYYHPDYDGERNAAWHQIFLDLSGAKGDWTRAVDGVTTGETSGLWELKKTACEKLATACQAASQHCYKYGDSVGSEKYEKESLRYIKGVEYFGEQERLATEGLLDDLERRNARFEALMSNAKSAGRQGRHQR